MNIVTKFLFCFLLLSSLASCGSYYNFDKLYAKQDYKQAYQVLKNSGDTGLPSYQERELKVVFKLALQGNPVYLPILDATLSKPTPKNMTNWDSLARAWIRFLSASTELDFQNVVVMIPQKPIKDSSIEQLKLIIYTHSLLRLKRYQEVIATLKISSHTKNSSDLLYIKGVAEYQMDLLEESEKSLVSLIKISSNPTLKSFGYFYLGSIKEKEEKYDEAEDCYMKAWDLNPKNAELNFRLGKILQKKSYSDLHSRFYRASLRLNENMAESWYYLNMQ